MSKEGDYLVFAIEQYRHAKGLSGEEVIALFKKYNIAQRIKDLYELYHIEREQNMIDDIDEFIASRKAA